MYGLRAGQRGICYVVPSLGQDSAEHFAHVPHFLEVLGSRIPTYAIVERGPASLKLPGVVDTVVLQGTRGLRFIRPLRLGLALLRMKRIHGITHVFVRISVPAAIVAAIVGRATGMRVWFWHSTFMRTLLPPWRANPLGRLRWELRLLPFRVALRVVHRLVTGPQSMAEYYAEDFGVHKSKILLLDNDIDTKRFCPGDKAGARRKLGIHHDGEIVLFVHRLSPRTGALHLPEIIRRTAQQVPSARFWIVGDGPSRQEVAAKLASLGLNKLTTMTGAVPNQALPPYYRAADVFIMPSNADGFPRVLLEAMASGLPFVAFRVGGVGDLVTPFQAQYTVTSGDLSAFVSKLVYLLTHPEEREALAAEGLRHVRRFDTNEVVRRFVEKLEE